MTKDEMTTFIDTYLSDKQSCDLYQVTDTFPSPPTEQQWSMHVEDLVLTGHLKQHPNGAHAVARKPTVRQVTHIDNSVKDSVVITQSRLDNSPLTANIKASVDAPIENPKQKNAKTTLAEYWWLYVIGVLKGLTLLAAEYDWFGLADKFKLK